jgi:hypothetical protein
VFLERANDGCADLVQASGAQYMKVVCGPSKSADQWVAEIQARKAALP